MLNTLDFYDLLKTAGMRITPQRIAIYEYLCGSDEHPTATTVFEHLQSRFPTLSLMTVYNTLKTLADLGAINVLGHAGDDNVHYDADTSPHINIACVSCHRILDYESQQISNLESDMSNASGFKLLGARMMYYGICPSCRMELQGAKVTK